MEEIKHQLRKAGFSQCISESLNIIEKLIVPHSTGRNIVPNSMDLVNEIISEFIFCEYNEDKSKSKPPGRRLNNIQELQLMEVLCAYFSRFNAGLSRGDNLTLYNTVFMCLFSGNGSSRDPLLLKLVSMAIATRSRLALVSAGIWLDQIGPTTVRGLALARGIVNDYLNLVPDAVEQLHDLPTLAPVFSAMFLTAVTHLYNELPPESILAVITLWITKTPELCSSNLPNSPIIGIMRWCVCSPFYNAEDKYSSFHLALLEAIVSCGQTANVPVSQLAQIVNSILEHAQHSPPTNKIKVALDRLALTIIVLLRAGNISGNISELLQQIDLLPENELMQGLANCRKVVPMN